LPEEKLGVTPAVALTEVEHGKNNLPDVLARWLRLRSAQGLELSSAQGLELSSAQGLELSVVEGLFSESQATRSLSVVETNEPSELNRARTEQSFCVPKADIVANGYDLSINRYMEVVHEVVEHRHPKDIMAKLAELETEIQAGMKKLEGMLF
jgi:type I restriction enzyme M protein